MPVNAINRQSSHETQITGESRNIFQAIADKFVAVVNSCKTFSTGCSTQKDHNIQKACERLAALTLVKPESYTTSEMKESAEKLGMTLPYDTESVSKRNLSAADSIGKLFTLKTTECSAQELHDMLSKQLDKPGTSPEMHEKIQTILGMADAGTSRDDIKDKVYADMVERGVNKLRSALSADILKEHRRNEIGGNEVLDHDMVKELEKLSNSLSS
ncbi:hypothetical protein JC794_20020 [Morganella morganii]|nr:hypothetical protein JC794_20020 [Morganella morganii]